MSIFFALSDIARQEVPGWVTGFYLLVLIGLVLCLAFEEKIHAKKSLIVGTFAGFCLVTETVIGYFTDRAHPMLPFGSITLPNGHEISRQSTGL